ncbi:hypothetical protein Tco_0335487 [Tanacetum coccineum]
MASTGLGLSFGPLFAWLGLEAYMMIQPRPRSLVRLLYVIKSPQSSMILLMEHVPYAVIIARLSLLRIAALLSSAIVMDIQEKDKNKSQNDKTEHENRKTKRRPPHTSGIHLHNPLQSNSSMKEDKDSRAMIIELGDYSKWRAKIDLRLTSHKWALDVFCHKYYIPEEVHPELPHPEMDLSAFIRVLDPTMVKTIERERAEGEAKLLETIVGRTILLLLIVSAYAEEELEASVNRIFSEDVCREQIDSAKVGTTAIEQTITVADTVVENVAIKKTRRQKKKRYAAADMGEASYPANKLRSDYGTVSGSTTGGKSPSVLKRLLAGVVLNTKVGIAAIPTLPFITTSISTTPERDIHDHTDSVSGLNLRNVEPSKGSLTPSILVMTNVTTTTTVVVLGSTSLSFSLSVLSSRVEKIRAYCSHSPCYSWCLCPLTEPLSVVVLTGAKVDSVSLPTPIATTTALSTTFATTSSIVPIYTDDYEVVDAENVQRNDTSFLNFEEETLNATL